MAQARRGVLAARARKLKSIVVAKRANAAAIHSAANASGNGDLPTEEMIFQREIERIEALVPQALFDEAAYLRLNPDVQRALELRQIESGYAHYLQHGHAEGRPVPSAPTESRNVMLPSSPRADVAPLRSSGAVDALVITPNAGLMIVGWIDDSAHPLNCIRIISAEWRLVLDGSQLMRVRRTDAEKALGSRTRHPFGFFGILHFERGGAISGSVTIELWQHGGLSTTLQCTPTPAEDVELRSTALAYLAGAEFFGNPAVECMGSLSQGVGTQLLALNQAMTRRIVANPYIEQFGRPRANPKATIVVCLYGKAEFLFLQNCLFAGLPGIDEYEFIYVCNSPELAETLMQEARSASLVYGMANKLVILSGNAGFGAANNAACRVANSNRVLIVNPDVFPKDPSWAARHLEVVESGPTDRTQIFGVPLYYDDGSLMHGGMHFEVDVGLSLSGGQPIPTRMCRVEHYGKGAPPETVRYTRSRPVPAITGAFMSLDRTWFEELGGFTEEFIFGHYEDADLCLKSIEKGVAPWLHDIRLWHLEGKGSTRQLPHEGGSLVNRWLFSQRWISAIENGLLGPEPTHPLLRLPPEAGISDKEPNRSSRRRRAATTATP